MILRVARTPKNCFRCGVEFRVGGSARLCGDCRKSSRAPRQPRHPWELAFRERQVVKLVAEAKMNKEIAYILHLTEGTIKEYLNCIFRKLNVKNRTELAVWAIQNSEFVDASQGSA